MDPAVSFILTHYKDQEFLKPCIESIKRHVRNFDYEIFVADSETQESTRRLIRNEFPDVILCGSKENVGFSKIVNAALKRTRGSYIAILNSDILLPDSSIENIFRYFEAHKNVGLAGPALFYPDGTPQSSAFRFYSPFTILTRRTFMGKTFLGKHDLDRFLMKDRVLTREPITVDWLMGSALFTTKKALNDVGPLDERFFMYFEDVDWSRRFWEKGYKVVYYPATRLIHHHVKTSKTPRGLLDLLSNPYARIHLASAVKYFLKHGPSTPRYGV